MKSSAPSTISSSIVSIRFFVSGPVSSIVCLPLFVTRHLSDAARPVALPEVGEVLRVRVVRMLGLLLGVEVVEVAEELVEPVLRRQVLVQVAEVVLAELPRRVAERLEELGDRRILGGDARLGDPGIPTLLRPVR